MLVLVLVLISLINYCHDSITLLIKYLLLLLFQKIITSLRPIAQQLPLSQLDEADQTKADAPGPDLLKKFAALTDKA